MSEIQRVLVANRGEIAVRVIRACRELGLESVAVYSDADVDALHVRSADTAVGIGPAPARQSYLNVEALLAAARETGADAVHPGYGFLAENPGFVRACEQAGLVFVGPSAEVVQRMGNKIAARRLAEECGVPVIPGLDRVDDIEAALRAADLIGYPVMIKAASGGGGRGIRLASDGDELRAAVPQAGAEAEAAFSDPTVYIEKALVRPRHVEIQLLGDGRGNVIHLHERDCSLQRRKQKLLEEVPSPLLSPELRAAMGEAAVALASRARYAGAGTVEFLVEEDRFYFIEMNTRIQVEHGITELVTGVDLVAEQLRLAMGHSLSRSQDEIPLHGAALELRICAEDASKDFFPSPGRVDRLVPPGGPGVRWDAGMEAGDAVQPYYDSLIGKLMVWAPTRGEAIARGRRALRELRISGVATTVPMHEALLRRAEFEQSDYHVGSVDLWAAAGSLLGSTAAALSAR